MTSYLVSAASWLWELVSGSVSRLGRVKTASEMPYRLDRSCEDERRSHRRPSWSRNHVFNSM